MAEAPPKKSRFNRPAWSKAPAQAKDDDHEFFRHSNNGYTNIIAEKAKRREERQREARRQEEEERQRQGNGRERKRRRLSTEIEDSKEGDAGGVDVKGEDKIRRESSRSIPPESPSSKRHDRSQQTQAKAAVVIDLDDDDGGQGHRSALPLSPSYDEDIAFVKSMEPPKPKPKGPYSDDESDEDDDYMRDIKRRAREKERQKRLGLEAKPANTPEILAESTRSPSFHDSRSPPAGPDVTQPNSFSYNTTEASQASGPSQNRPEDDPIIDILIRSPLPDTKPLLVRRRASQPLAEVRLAWCKLQLFDKAATDKIFFTWRGNRVFDVTTCQNFLSRAEKEKDEGRDVFETDWESKAGAEGPRIEVVATTQDIFDQERKRQETRKAAAAAAAAAANGDSNSTTVIDADADADAASEAAAALPEPPKAPKLRITFKSPGLPDLLLKVGPDHTIGKIVRAFRQQQGLPSAEAGADGDADKKNVYVLFDGERLEEEMRVGETEIEDLDSVDVIVR